MRAENKSKLSRPLDETFRYIYFFKYNRYFINEKYKSRTFIYSISQLVLKKKLSV